MKIENMNHAYYNYNLGIIRNNIILFKLCNTRIITK